MKVPPGADGRSVPPGARDLPAGQTDSAPTLLALLGIDAAPLPYVGRNLLGAPGDPPLLRPYGDWLDSRHLFLAGTASGRGCATRYVRMLSPMTQRIALAIVLVLGGAASVRAQDQPPRLPFIVVDVHGTFANVPATQVLVDSRGLTSVGQLPGAALGADVGLHLYPLRWRAITFGIGGRVMGARARQVPATIADQTPLTPVTERLLTGAPEISINFGSGNGWSYISGGIGRSIWQVVPDGADRQSADEERLQTSNYGGGARWFIKTHLAFSFDVRIYGIKGGTPAFGFPGSPRTNLLVIGAGVSVKP